VEDQAVVLHLLTKRRQDLVAARTQTINRLHRLLMDLLPGGTCRNLTTKRAAALLATVTPAGAPAVTRWQLATELVADIRHLEQHIAAVEARIKTAVAHSSTSLLGCSAWGRCWRPRSSARSATSAGSPPSTTLPPTPAPPRWRPPAARSCATGCHGPGTAS
jgi:transposase